MKARTWRALAGGVSLVAVGGGLGFGADTPGPAGTKKISPFLYPPSPAVIQSSYAAIILVGDKSADSPQVKDGGPLMAWERYDFAPAMIKPSRPGAAIGPSTGAQAHWAARLSDKSKQVIWVGTVSLTSGENTINLGGQAVRLYRASGTTPGEPPKNWPVFGAHPTTDTADKIAACSICHEVKKSAAGSLLGPAAVPKTCETCHSPVDLRLAHSHVMDPLSDCLMCHDPHGSLRPKLLLDEKSRLCQNCHEAGHFMQ